MSRRARFGVVLGSALFLTACSSTAPTTSQGANTSNGQNTGSSSAASGQCTQPCAVSGNLVLTIQGFHTATQADTGASALVIDFTLAQSAQSTIVYSFNAGDHMYLNDSSHPPVGYAEGWQSVTLASGATVQCSPDFQLQPGQTVNDLHRCYPQGDLDISQSIRLDWTPSTAVQPVSIDLGTPN